MLIPTYWVNTSAAIGVVKLERSCSEVLGPDCINQVGYCISWLFVLPKVGSAFKQYHKFSVASSFILCTHMQQSFQQHNI